MGKQDAMQETRLACHAAPAQPQCGNLGDDLLLEDMHALLRGHVGQQQVSQAPATLIYIFMQAV